jgi:hypothetical protein
MSSMAEMSRAIRLELRKHGETLKDLPDEELADFTQITGAFWLDLREEYVRRHPEAHAMNGQEAAQAEIDRQQAIMTWASGQLESYHPDLLRVQEVLIEAHPTRAMFFAALPDWDYEVSGGTGDEPRWAYEVHPWFAQLGITKEECEEFWGRRNAT